MAIARTRFRRKAKVGSVIPTASMADISFLLLVFFMVSTVFVRYRGIPVNLPEAEKIEKIEMRRHIAHVWIDNNGSIMIDDQVLALDQVATVLHARVLDDRRLIVSIKADGDAPFGLLSDLLLELRRVEALRVNFATEREKDGSR